MTADITERKQTETDLVATKQQAEVASKAKSDFLASMNHELRTPLNAILGFAQVLRSVAGSLNDHQNRCIQHIKKSGRHLLGLVNEVLDLTRIEDGRITLEINDTSLETTINDAIAGLRDVSDLRGISVTLENFEGVTVRADPERLRQILDHLLVNAIRHNLENGSVSVQVSDSDHDMMRISVIDNGPGIAEKHHDNLFQPFNRFDNVNTRTDGAGIGLALVHRLVEIMHGRVGMQSAPGKGSTFWFELPQKDRRRAARRASDQPGASLAN